MYILGINAYHGGASACLINDGQLVAAVEEERFNRIKYAAGFPVQAIHFVLAEAGIQPGDIDHIGISRRPTSNLMKKALYAFRHRPSLDFITDRLNNALKVGDLKSDFCERLGLEASSLKATFHNVEHHRAHMASAFFVSPFQEAAILSVDGMGDFVSTMWGMGKGTQIEVTGEINFPHSLGIFYTAVTQWLGFPKYGDEGKVMGLAPYGRPMHMDKMRKLVQLKSNGTFELGLDYFVHHAEGVTMSWTESEPKLGLVFSDEFVKLFGVPRTPYSKLTEYHNDVAASMQVMLEEAEFALLRRLQAETKQTALCMAGGVALNSSFNGKILTNTSFEDVFIQPAAGDAGTSLGVCYYIYHQVLDQPRTFVMHDAYTGPSYSNAQIKAALDINKLHYELLDDDELARRAAALVAEGNILGWFQGRMEWGPRALGNRSIIADSRRENMKDILNARIKHREPFRPFAPAILLEDVGEYFDQDYPDPFMIKVYNVRPEKHSVIPAVTHVDGTGRLQTVSREYGGLYYKLINAFKQQTGVPVILNTSFNENEPIVCTPEEAISVLLRTRLDALAIGNYLILKDANSLLPVSS